MDGIRAFERRADVLFLDLILIAVKTQDNMGEITQFLMIGVGEITKLLGNITQQIEKSSFKLGEFPAINTPVATYCVIGNTNPPQMNT